MMNKRNAAVILGILLFCTISTFCVAAEQSNTKGNWNDLMHFLRVGRLELAKDTANLIIQNEPDSVEMLQLSDDTPYSINILTRASQNTHDAELANAATGILNIINKGRFSNRRDPKVLIEEVKRLNSTERGFRIALKRLHDAGEYSIMYMVDALVDENRQDERPRIIRALPSIGKDAIRPIAAALQMENITVKQQIIQSLGIMEYPQAMAYLKYVMEKDESTQLRQAARDSIAKIDPQAITVPSSQLFYKLAENYYYHMDSLAPAEDLEFANVWFWQPENKRLHRIEVDKKYFYELMAMRCCEWALTADASCGEAIGLWVASYFKAESAGVDMPSYFGPGHADAMTYATTAGPEYLHQALARAVKDNNAYVALGVVEALAEIAGEKSLMYRLGIAQPLIQSLSFDDKAVKYSSAIAIALAGPVADFEQSDLVANHLAAALGQGDVAYSAQFSKPIADSYAIRAAQALLNLGKTKNKVVNLNLAQNALVSATRDSRDQMQILAGQTLAYISSDLAQAAILAMGLNENNSDMVRVEAFNSLSVSAKNNACMLENNAIDLLYALVSSTQAKPELRSAAAAAYGALNLPSRKVKELILDQAKK